MRLIEKCMQTGEFRIINRGFVKQQLLFMSSLLADSKFLAENKLTYAEAIEKFRKLMFFYWQTSEAKSDVPLLWGMRTRRRSTSIQR